MSACPGGFLPGWGAYKHGFATLDANATALTGTTPTGSLSKITQFTFGALDRANPATNLITAGMTSEVASNASNLLMDIKPGYMLGAKPREQAWGHVIGVIGGGIAATFLFFPLFLPEYDASLPLGPQVMTEKFPMPGVDIWKGVATLIASGALAASVQETFPLSRIKDAVAAAASGGRSGKILLVP